MGCCGGECSCGKKDVATIEEHIHLVQLPANGEVLPVFDWSGSVNNISVEVELVELRFKNGRKEFFRTGSGLELAKDDRVVVESDKGFDVGTVSLSGKGAQKKFGQGNRNKPGLGRVVRKTTMADLQGWLNAKSREYGVLNEARRIAIETGAELDIKDVEFRGDGQKLTIYYVSAESSNFGELVGKYTTAFRVKVEMFQVGIRQVDLAEYN